LWTASLSCDAMNTWMCRTNGISAPTTMMQKHSGESV
jgi:hypothetical protein